MGEELTEKKAQTGGTAENPPSCGQVAEDAQELQAQPSAAAAAGTDEAKAAAAAEAEETGAADLEQKLEELREAIGKLEEEKKKWEEEKEELISRLHRLQADFDNYRKRTAKEKEEWFTQAVCDLVGELLPVLDNLERALEAKGSTEAVLEGVQMVYRQFLSVLEKQGVEAIEAYGTQFDPFYHHAVMQVECEEPENTVVEELQKGYKLKERVIRPSMVKVAK